MARHTPMALVLAVTAATYASACTLQEAASNDATVSTKSALDLAGKPIPVDIHYKYPVSWFEDSFTRYNSNHDYYGVAIRPNALEHNHYGIRAWHSGYGDEYTTFLNLETGEVVETSANYGPQPPRVTRISAPVSASDLRTYLNVLRSIKHMTEFVATPGHGSGFEPARPELNESLAYIDSILLQLDPPAQDTLSSTVNKYDFRQGQTGSLSVAYRSSNERDLLVDFFINSAYQSGQRISLRPGEGNLDVTYAIPESTPAGASGYISFKLVPKGEAWTHKTAEVNVPFQVTGGNRFWDAELTYDKLVPNKDFEVEVWFYATQRRDIRVDILDSNGKWVTGKQWTSRNEQGGYDSAFIPAPASIRPAEQYKLYFKLLPVGAPWSAYLDQRELTVQASAE